MTANKIIKYPLRGMPFRVLEVLVGLAVLYVLWDGGTINTLLQVLGGVVSGLAFYCLVHVCDSEICRRLK